MADENIVFDGTYSFKGGQNAAIDPAEIGANQYFIGVNVSAQTGSLVPRWGLTDLPLDFSDTGYFTRTSGVNVSWKEVFESGKFQAFIPYSIGPDYFNLYVISGYVFVINLETLTVGVINPDDPVNVDADRINWSNAGEYLVIFDYPNYPFILEGIQIRRADPANNEVPISVLGAYNQNRLMIANAGLGWTAGDPAGSTAAPDAPITFNEVMVPSSPYVADVYEVPTAVKNNTHITAMGFLSVLDKSTEIGSLLVGTEDSIYAYPTFLPRANWQGGSADYVFGSMLLNQGIVGQRAQTNVNSDYFFKSPDRQIYAFTMARNQQYRWSNSPISKEVEIFLEKGDRNLEFISFCSTFKNKIFYSCYPYRVNCTSAEGLAQFDYVNRGVTVIEMADAASLSQEGTPIWAGVWTGIEFSDFIENNQRFYCAGKYQGRNHMFLIDPDKTYDTYEGKKVNIRSVVVTKEYVNENPTINKEIQSLELGLRNIREDFTVEISYNSDVNETFYPWKTFNYFAPTEQCEGIPKFPQGLQSQGIRDLNIGGVNQNDCYIPAGDYPYVYKGVQIRLVLTGRAWKLKYVKLNSVIKEQPLNATRCEQKPPVGIPNQCFNLWELANGSTCN